MLTSPGDMSYVDKLALLQSIGYDREVCQNALQAADGDIEVAVEIIMGDQTNIINNGPGSEADRSRANNLVPLGDDDTSSFSPVGKTSKEILDHYSKKLLGEKHPEVRAQVKASCKSIKNSWKSAVAKLNDFDQRNQISTRGKEVIHNCDTKMKAFDEKHQWSQKANAAATTANSSAINALNNAKRGLESREDTSSGVH